MTLIGTQTRLFKMWLFYILHVLNRPGSNAGCTEDLWHSHGLPPEIEGGAGRCFFVPV